MSLDHWRNTLLRDKPLGLWPLHASSMQGAPVRDRSGLGHDGALTSGWTDSVTEAPGPQGLPCLRNVGAHNTEHVVIPGAAWMDIQALTVELWFKVGDISADTHGLMGRDNPSGATRPWTVTMEAPGQVRAFANNQLGPNFYTTATGLDDDRWHHFAWAYDAGTGEGAHYLEGLLDNAYSGGGTLPSSASLDLWIGAASPAAGSFDLGGSFAYAAMFDRVLTAAQIKAHYQAIAHQMT